MFKESWVRGCAEWVSKLLAKSGTSVLAFDLDGCVLLLWHVEVAFQVACDFSLLMI